MAAKIANKSRRRIDPSFDEDSFGRGAIERPASIDRLDREIIQALQANGREPFRRETARQWADLAALGAIEGLPLELPGWSRARIDGPTRGEIDAALRRWLDPDALAVAVGLPAP